jgi:hypothetical protein
MVRAYVESLLEKLIGTDHLVADDDGDYPVRYRDALYYVRLVGENYPIVQVFSIAVADIAGTPELMAALNELNSQIRFARAFWVRGQVLIEVDLIGETLEPVSFDNACQRVATITDDVAKQLAANHGGRTAFEDEKTEHYEAPDGAGMYL